MQLAEVWRQAWRVPDRRPVYDWAAKGRLKLPPVYTISGEFNIERSRHLIEIFDCLHDDAVRSVTVLAPPRSGKSMIADIWIPSVLIRDPGPVMWNMQTKPLSTRHFATRVLPIFKSCELGGLLPRRFKNTEIIFTNSIPFCIDGPSIGNLQSIGIRYKVNDECWIWPVGRLKEANARVRDYEKLGISKVLTISQGGFAEEDLDEEWKAGDCREWNVCCLSCGKPQEPVIRGIRNDGSRWGIRFDGDVADKNGKEQRPIEDRLGAILPTVRFECFHCGQAMKDTERTTAEWNRLGRYAATNADPRPGAVSFHYPSTMCRPWTHVVTDFLAAMEAYKRGSMAGLITFTQKDDAKSWSELSTLNADPFRQEKFDIRSEAKASDLRILTVDRQEAGMHWGTVHGIKRNAAGRIEIRRLWFGKLWSELEIQEKQKEFEIKAHHVLIDTGWEARPVYAMCCRNGWIALKGEDDKFFLKKKVLRKGQDPQVVRSSTAVPGKGDPEMGKGGQGARFCHLIRWSNPSIFDRLKRMLDTGFPVFIVAADGDPALEKEYQTQMRAQYPQIQINKVTGKRVRVWVCPSRNNHAWDCTCMLLVALTELEILPDEVTIDTSREATSVGAQKEAA